MGRAHPFARQRAFDCETLQIMEVALACAWHALMVSGSTLTASFRAEHTRDAPASRIMPRCAEAAERLDWGKVTFRLPGGLILCWNRNT